MSFCINCGKGLAPDDMFCQSCGKPVVKNETKEDVFQSPQQPIKQNNQATPQQTVQQPQYSQQPIKKSGGGKMFIIIGIIVFLFLLIVGGGIAGYFYISKKAETISEDLKKEITKEIPKDIKKEEPKQNTVKEEIPDEEKTLDTKTTEKNVETPTNNLKKEKTDCGYYPYLSTRKISADELDGTPFEDLRLMRNEIFMRHGLIFKSADLKSYFSKFPCYNPRYDDVTSMLTEIEKYNINIIKGNEKR